jgi:hypothetical protein
MRWDNAKCILHSAKCKIAVEPHLPRAMDLGVLHFALCNSPSATGPRGREGAA